MVVRAGKMASHIFNRCIGGRMRKIGMFLAAILAVVIGMFLYGAVCDFISGDMNIQEIVYPRNFQE